MATSTLSKKITVALIGNPNTGKSTLFSALAGVRQHVGNYPGVTVEKKTGSLHHAGHHFELIDLPGTYSLAPRSPDEMVAVDVLLGRRKDVDPPDVILSIVDASNLERNLYLVNQVLELGRPVVLALNMTDIAVDRGIVINVEELEDRLNIPVVLLQAHRKQGIDLLKVVLAEAAEKTVTDRESPFPEAFQNQVDRLLQVLNQDTGSEQPRYLAERLLLDTGGYIESNLLTADHSKTQEQLTRSREELAAAGMPIPAIEAMSRYEWVHQILAGVVTRPAQQPTTWSDTVDKILTHKLLGTLIFAVLMLFVFCSIFYFAAPVMDWIDGIFGSLQEVVATRITEGPLQSLITDGIIGGVGSVVIFLPQILILFFFIAVLEDCGYMARAAYLMDKMMSGVGLSGKSFIPLLSSFACAIPGIMATRVIENRRDRLTTILVAPLMSCSARIPVYTILIAAFIPNLVLVKLFSVGEQEVFIGLQGVTFFAMYFIGILVAVAVAWVLKKTFLRGETPAFVMELPSYKIPSPKIVLFRMVERGWAFLRRAGTIVFAVAVVIWAMTYYPRNPELVEQQLQQQVKSSRLSLETRLDKVDPGSAEEATLRSELAALEDEDTLDNLRASIQQKNSILGQLGQWVEPVVRPLGWDWRIGCAAIASFPAREVVMGVLGVLYNLGDDIEDEEPLVEKLRTAKWDGTEKKVFNIPVALSIMVFFALCAQCAATLAVIKRETNGWRWPVFTFTYMTIFAYVGALATYQLGMLFMK